jgi:hypothetical protein
MSGGFERRLAVVVPSFRHTQEWALKGPVYENQEAHSGDDLFIGVCLGSCRPARRHSLDWARDFAGWQLCCRNGFDHVCTAKDKY